MNLGIDGKTWRKYKKTKKEFRQLIEKSRVPVILTLRNALYERARGAKHVVEKAYIRPAPTGGEAVFREKIITHDPPNVAAIHLLLKNIDKGNWADDPVMQEIARAKSGMDAAASMQEAERLSEEQLQEYIDRTAKADEFLKGEVPRHD